VLSLVIAIHQASGEPILASVAVLPWKWREIEDTYPLY
jgi:GntR family transcriptional regulator